jgi:hypothetical protein
MVQAPNNNQCAMCRCPSSPDSRVSLRQTHIDMLTEEMATVADLNPLVYLKTGVRLDVHCCHLSPDARAGTGGQPQCNMTGRQSHASPSWMATCGCGVESCPHINDFVRPTQVSIRVRTVTQSSCHLSGRYRDGEASGCCTAGEFETAHPI